MINSVAGGSISILRHMHLIWQGLESMRRLMTNAQNTHLVQPGYISDEVAVAFPRTISCLGTVSTTKTTQAFCYVTLFTHHRTPFLSSGRFAALSICPNMESGQLCRSRQRSKAQQPALAAKLCSPTLPSFAGSTAAAYLICCSWSFVWCRKEGSHSFAIALTAGGLQCYHSTHPTSRKYTGYLWYWEVCPMKPASCFAFKKVSMSGLIGWNIAEAYCGLTGNQDEVYTHWYPQSGGFSPSILRARDKVLCSPVGRVLRGH